MTKEALRQIIKEMVQEEVRQSLPELLPQIMAEVFSSKSPKVSNKPQPVTQTRPVVTPPVVAQPMKVYTKNDKLNKALNETTMNIPREGSSVSPGMGQTTSIMDQVDNIPAPVAQALTKNYSSLMKAIDKKRSGGMGVSNSVGLM